ncbi:hypothetical protein D3C78_1513030 [compost metagenome]
MNGAGAAKAHAAAKLGAVVTGHVTDRPEQGHVLGDIERMVLTVEFQGNHGQIRLCSFWAHHARTKTSAPGV